MKHRLIALPLLTLGGLGATPLAAQDHDHAAHTAAAPEPDNVEPDSAAPAADPAASHAAMDHSQMDHGSTQHGEMDHGTMDHGAMDHGTMDHGATGHGQADSSQMDHAAMGHAAPAPSADGAPPARALEGPRHAADAIWGEAAMAASRGDLVEEMTFRTTSVMVERLEARLSDEDGYLWDMQAFSGGDIDRFVLKSEGEGSLGSGHVEDAELQALWSHAITPFFDLQAGARLDVEPETRSHLVLGVQGLAPYMWHIDAAAFLSDRGDLTARVEAEYDQKITQALILQPRVELEAAAQDIPERDLGAGLTSVSAGLRLRYEILREFAPYVGVEWESRIGATRRIARANGDDPSATAIVLGIRTWF